MTIGHLDLQVPDCHKGKLLLPLECIHINQTWFGCKDRPHVRMLPRAEQIGGQQWNSQTGLTRSGWTRPTKNC